MWIDGSTLSLSLLRNGRLPDHLLPRTYDTAVYEGAILNPKGLEFTDRVGRLRLCLRCHKSLAAGKMPKFALSNWLYYGYDALPAEVADSFRQSSLFEKMLICRARCNSVICRFNAKQVGENAASDALNRERKGMRGNVMVAPLDVFRMNDVIPPQSQTIRDTMCAIFVGDRLPTRTTLSKYSPVLVRKTRVKALIQFLIANNPYYRPSADFSFSQSNLDSLFEECSDEGILSSVHIGYIPANDAINAATSDYTLRNVDGSIEEQDEEDLLMENVGYTEGDDSPLSYQTMKNLAMERCLQGRPFIASGKGSRSLPDFRNPAILTWLFPHLDPWGIGGFYHPGRTVQISMQEQLAHLLLVDGSPFERDAQFPTVFYNIGRKYLVNQTLKFAVAQRLQSGIANELLSIDPEVLILLNERCQKNPGYRPQGEEERKAFDVHASLKTISSHLPGSDGYKIMLRNEIRALITYRGTPTLFITLNPSDVDHPLVRLIAGDEFRLQDMSLGEDMKEWQRKLFAARNPASCARFFDYVITKFLEVILGFGKDGGGLYGKCDAYYGVVEAQGKGTLHLHLLVWLQGHLSPQALRDKMNSSEGYKEAMFKWLESVIECEFPGPSSTEAQVRNHPKRVLRGDSGDPHPGVICNPLTRNYSNDHEGFWTDFEQTLVRLLHHYSWHVHQPTCWKYLQRGQERSDENCRLGMDRKTRESTEVDPETEAILLRRLHPSIAAHTGLVTFLMQCNMDIKFVGSGDAAKAFLYYLTDYLTKLNLPVHVGMLAISYALKKTFPRLPENVQERTEAQSSRAVVTAVNSMMGRQEISHPQIMSYLVGGGDTYKSEKFCVLHWSAIRRFVEKFWRTQEGREGREDFEETVSLTLGPRSVDISSQLLDYVYRSEDSQFSSLCLYDFVSTTAKVRHRQDQDSGRDRQGAFVDCNHPQINTHYLVIRKQQYVPVLLGPKIPNRDWSAELLELWSRDVLTLFKPWRSPGDLKTSQESWTQAFETFRTSLNPLHTKILKNMSVLTECNEARDRHPRGNRQATDATEQGVNEADPDLPDIEHITDIIFDPYRDFDADHSPSSNVTGSRDDILSPDVSSMLDMCLPLSSCSVDLVETTPKEPSKVTDDVLPMLAGHSAFMTEKRKRKHRAIDEEANRPRPLARRARQTSPIATRAVLGNDSHPVDESHRIAESVVSEMNLASNAEQLAAFNLIARHVMEHSQEQLLMYVSGVGGTGKSHVVKSIVKLFDKLGRGRELLLGAPTGIAAVLIGGQTLHSLILATPNSKSKDVGMLSKIWRHVKYLIVDEVSMVGARFLSQLSCRMRQGKGDDVTSSIKPFGGVNVIFMGDFAQLKPPKQFALYAHELVRNQSFAQASNTGSISALNGAFLWRQVSVSVELVRNQRHSEDQAYASFLSRLRLGICESQPIQSTGLNDLEYIKGRLLQNQLSHPELLEAFKDAPIIVGSKNLRDVLCAKLVRYHAKRLRAQLAVYYSSDFVDKKQVTGTVQQRLWSLPSAVNKESFGRLPLFVGMKVMVTENLAFDNGIVNGSEGIVHDIIFDEDEQARRYAKAVYVRFDGCGVHVEGFPIDVVPIFPVATRIELSPGHRPLPGCKAFNRRQLPLVPAYVYTDFKSQGRTLRYVIVDLATARGQGVYVMLSRVKSLTGLLILRWFPPSKIFHRLPEELRDELKRLDDIKASIA
ncbi:hypothetical protein CVT26_002879 [Gymnopilus dilepis]|uniref:ATP-dependent DNA helicase n=1 Tax=Gymnopilus dilepis TaxID=231916 RepID=A0A409WR98_9AGAR|nr:hypothetical protein CVT26_002879 [Gymnopilus dilepis]